MSNATTRKFLTDLTNKDCQVQIFLVNGIKLVGAVVAVDDECLLLYSGKTQLVYHHAISTVQEK